MAKNFEIIPCVWGCWHQGTYGSKNYNVQAPYTEVV